LDIIYVDYTTFLERGKMGVDKQVGREYNEGRIEN